MRTYIWFAILGLLVMEALLLPRTIRDFRIMQKTRAENVPDEGLPATLSPFAGFDAGGHPVTPATEETRWILPLIIRSATATHDLDYLRKLRKAIPRRELALVGVCEPSDCVAAFPKGQAEADFTVVAYGSYAPLLDIARFDDRDQLLLLNQYWGVKQALRRAPSPEDLAVEIQQAIGQ
jgi:hypothetical protein